MITRLCDRCGQPIEEGELRFIVKIQVFAAYDPLAISFDDLSRDHRAEIRAILDRCAGMTEEELMRDVYVERQFDLCRPCQRVYLENPLPAGG